MGLVCRVAEEAGIATVCVSTGRDLTVQVLPPRSAFVNFPMGNNFGAPGDVERQSEIMRTALAMIHETEQAGRLIDLPYEWSGPFEYFTGRGKKTAEAAS